jgi:hypothetical protein
MQGGALGTIVTSLAWVSRGFAQPLLDSYEPTEKELKSHKKVSKKELKDIAKNPEAVAE